jgi:hypothetical protein
MDTVVATGLNAQSDPANAAAQVGTSEVDPHRARGARGTNHEAVTAARRDRDGIVVQHDVTDDDIAACARDVAAVDIISARRRKGRSSGAKGSEQGAATDDIARGESLSDHG